MGEVVVEGSWWMERKRRMNTEEEKGKEKPQETRERKNNIERKPTYRFYLIATYHLYKRKNGDIKVRKLIKDLK